jgi:glycerol-3-phosphate acyltransferase PlsY
METIIIGFLLSFFLGAIPTSFCIGKWVGHFDIREQGSGNVGTTNINRTLGTKWGFFVLFFDSFKGIVTVWILPQLIFSTQFPLETTQALYGLGAITGHVWTPFLGFNGGKGVATSLGVFALLSWTSTLIAVVVFIISVKITRYISAGSIIAVVIVPPIMLLLHEPKIYLVLSMVISVIIVKKHKENLKRLALGQENKFSFKKEKF